MENKELVEELMTYIKNQFSLLQQLERKPNPGGAIRKINGETTEEIVQKIWNFLAEKYPGKNASVKKGDDTPIVLTDFENNSIEESVDQHCFINNKLVLTVECKSYLDKCYMQRADSDFQLMKTGSKESFDCVILSFEDGIALSTFKYFMNRKNIDHVFYLAEGKRCSKKEKRLYNNIDKVKMNLIEAFVSYCESFFIS